MGVQLLGALLVAPQVCGEREARTTPGQAAPGCCRAYCRASEHARHGCCNHACLLPPLPEFGVDVAVAAGAGGYLSVIFGGGGILGS
jgi:hypothetical protein